MQWLIYGANGFTAGLIINEAIKREMNPILAGRNEEKIKEIADRHQLEYRIFNLNDISVTSVYLMDIDVVLHCAGPYTHTAQSMIESCIRSQTHYVDISGEIEVFKVCQSLDAKFRENDIVAIPGAGFDVVPTDVLAAITHQKYPEARGIKLAIHSEGKPSKGTAKTTIQHIGGNGLIRENDILRSVSIPYRIQNFTFEVINKKGMKESKQRLTMTVPLPDVFTAAISSGFTEIEIYSSLPPSTIRSVKLIRKFKFLFKISFVQKFLQYFASRRVENPEEDFRKNTRSYIVAEAYTQDLHRKPMGKLQLTTINSYNLTAITSVQIVNHLLHHGKDKRGFYTPSQLMGTVFLLEINGNELKEMEVINSP